MRARFLWHFPYLERIQGVLDGVPRGPQDPVSLQPWHEPPVPRWRQRVHELRHASRAVGLGLDGGRPANPEQARVVHQHGEYEIAVGAQRWRGVTDQDVPSCT